MKKIYIISSLLLLLSGCGSSSSKDSIVDDKVPYGFKGYKLYDYIAPKDDKEVLSYKYKNKNFYQEERLEYKNSGSIITQRSLTNLGGAVEFQNPVSEKDFVDVVIYKDNKQEHFKMNNYVDINSTITKDSSECKITKHYEKLIYDKREFDDVLEISCPKSVGYYQKGSGLVVENDIEAIESNSFNYIPDYGDRKLVDVDSGGSSFTTMNLESAKEVNVDILWASSYNLNGEGMTIGLVDGGRVLETHVELDGRVENLSNSDYNKHATHVAGTLISSGVHLPESRGFAKNAHILTLDYQKLHFAEAVKELLSYGVLISNHSYGFEGADGLGEYDGESRDFDKLISENPYVIAVLASGNDGKKYKDDSDFKKWGIIKGGANSKNVITVASVNDDSGKISNFSSRGPINGGRLKPDISLDGFNVLSTVVNKYDVDNDSYGRLYGTSMAAPGVTGAITLLSQRYKEINSANPRVDTIKAIIFNTAKDIENIGPDFKSGFGQLDALKAVKVIDSMGSSNSLVKLDNIRKNEHQKYRINSNKYQDFKVTLAWVDEVDSCSNCANDALVNDIDIYLENDETKEIIYPYTLDEFSPDKDAIMTKQNHKDPQEQIEALLKPANYTLHIIGTKIPSVKNFTMVSNIALGDVETNIKIEPMREHIHSIYDSIKEK
jgi:hypothetical protein